MNKAIKAMVMGFMVIVIAIIAIRENCSSLCIAIILCLDRNIALGGDLQQVLERAFDMNNRTGSSRSEKFKLLDQ